MRKLKKVMISAMILLSVTSMANIQTFAYQKTTKKDTSDLHISYWSQYNWKTGNIGLNSKGYDTLSSGGCGYFSYAALLKKIQSVDEKFKPDNLLSLVQKNNLQNTSWGHLNFEKSDKLNLGLKYVKHDFTVNGTGSSKQVKQTLKNYFNNGNFVIACFSNGYGGKHYIAIDYIDENDNIRIFDSGFVGTFLKDYYFNKNIDYLIIFESTDGKKANEINSIYGDDLANKYNKEIEIKKEIRELENKRNKYTKSENSLKNVSKILNKKS